MKAIGLLDKLLSVYNWRSKRQIGRPVIKSISECSPSDSEFSTPLVKRHAFSFMLNYPTTAFIISLFFKRTPFAIIRGVAFVVINALNAVITGRAFTHVSIESFKRVYPLTTNSNASSSIRYIFMVIDVVASGLQSFPREVFRSFTKTVSRFKWGHFNILSDIAQNKGMWKPVLSTGIRSLNLSTGGL